MDIKLACGHTIALADFAENQGCSVCSAKPASTEDVALPEREQKIKSIVDGLMKIKGVNAWIEADRDKNMIIHAVERYGFFQRVLLGVHNYDHKWERVNIIPIEELDRILDDINTHGARADKARSKFIGSGLRFVISEEYPKRHFDEATQQFEAFLCSTRRKVIAWGSGAVGVLLMGGAYYLASK